MTSVASGEGSASPTREDGSAAATAEADPRRCAPDAPEERAVRDSVRPSLLGLVLCGGRSERMGTDKALVDFGGRTFLDHQIDCLRAAVGRVVLACGDVPRYEDRGLELALDPPVAPTAAGEAGRTGPEPDRGSPPGGSRGPLAGLVAGLEGLRPGETHLAVVGVDMPAVSPEVFEHLYLQALEQRADAVLLASGGRPEPCCAVYARTCAAPARAALEAGEGRMIAFHAGLRIVLLEACELPIDLRTNDPSRNVNTPEDLRRERARFGGAQLPGGDA